MSHLYPGMQGRTEMALFSFNFSNTHIEQPVYVDIIAGYVFEISDEYMNRNENTCEFFIADRSLILIK